MENEVKDTQPLLRMIEEMKVEKNTDEYCLYIVNEEINRKNKARHQKNVKYTKYMGEIDENIPTKVVNYQKYKDEIDVYFKIEHFPKLLCIKGYEIISILPVFDFSILEGED